MKNLFFAELYRAKKSKSPLILLLVCFGLSLMTGAVYGLMFGNVPWLQTMYDEYFGFNPFSIPGDLELDPDLGGLVGFFTVHNYGDFISFAIKGNLRIFIVFFVAVFLTPLRRSGFIKNIASHHSRTQVFLVHAILVVIYSFLLTDVSVIAMILMILVFFRGLPTGGILNLLVYTVTAGLLLSAIGIFVLMLTDLMKRQMPAIVLSMIYLWFGAPLLFSASEVARLLKPEQSFRIEYISLVGNLQLLSVGRWDTVWSSLLVIAAYVGIAFLLELTLIKRRDLI